MYVSRSQPATKVYFGPELGIKPFWLKCSDFRRIYCHRCCLPRLAKNLVCQVYYDSTPYWCAPGKGCHGKRQKDIKAMRAARRVRRRQWRSGKQVKGQAHK